MAFVFVTGAAKSGSFSSKKKKYLIPILWILFWTVLFSALLACSVTYYYMRHYATMDAHLFSLYLRGQARTTTLHHEETDTPLATSENRIYASYDTFPDHLAQAFVAIEDQRFYTHHGVDWRRTAGAVGQFLLGRQSYGGSTITQQLIKNMTGEADVSPARKLKEIGRALDVETHLSKEEILEIYLNTVYLSHRCYGVQSAANYYFDTDVSDLTLPQCATLAAIIQAPTKWDPVYHPEANRSRRNLVLYKMKELQMITEAEYQSAVDSPLGVTEHPAGQNTVLSWYEEAVAQEATQILQELYELDRIQAQKLLYTGGLSIDTAQADRVQQTLEELYTSQGTFPIVKDSLIQPQSAAIVLDPHTGAILGIVGARGEKEENRILNYATDTLRPPGSALKPLSVYAPAMEAGLIHGATVYDDTPCNFTVSSAGWPQNYPNGYRGLTTIRDAVARSVNTVAVKVLQDYGIDRSFAFLQEKLHFSSLVSQKTKKNGDPLTDRAPAPLALGQLSYGVSVKELTAGYTIFTDEGVYHEPFSVWEMRDGSGNVIFTRDAQGERVLSRENAQAMTQLLKTVTTQGTASRLSLAKQMDTAGKTGTTTDDCDRWFVGYTPDYLCGVWFGYATPQSLTEFSETVSPALSAWDQIMTRLESPRLEQGERSSFATDLLIRANVCQDSGKQMTGSCTHDPRGNRATTAYFTAAQLPKEGCDCHIDVLYDREHSGVCLGGCSAEHLTVYSLIRTPLREFPRQVVVEDAQYVYRPLGDAVPGNHIGVPFFIETVPKGSYVGISPGERQFNCACYDHWYTWHLGEEQEEEEEEKTEVGKNTLSF